MHPYKAANWVIKELIKVVCKRKPTFFISYSILVREYENQLSSLSAIKNFGSLNSINL